MHTYPYKAQVPISGEANRVFTCDKDIWDVVKLLIAETKETNEKMGKRFDIARSVSQQLPFFSCMNVIFNKECQKDISKYLYCQKFNVPPFKGTYEDQSFKWSSKANIIETAMVQREKREYKKAQAKAKANVGGQNG